MICVPCREAGQQNKSVAEFYEGHFEVGTLAAISSFHKDCDSVRFPDEWSLKTYVEKTWCDCQHLVGVFTGRPSGVV